ncbi:uncharacterized protein V6R79_007959 [Siganus canaliculatus]
MFFPLLLLTLELDLVPSAPANVIEMQSEPPVSSQRLRVPVVGGRRSGREGWRRAEKQINASSAYRDAISSDVQMKSGTQLHSSFSELFHTVKPTDSNEC